MVKVDEFISKDKTIKLLENLGGCDAMDEYSKGYDEAISAAIYDVRVMKPADVQPVSRWINIKDKLPEEDGAYLCYLESGIVCEANYDSTIASEGEFPFGEWVTYYNSDTLGAEDTYWEAYDAITHWMELPNPPKDGDVETELIGDEDNDT